jgi:hypothetical protein
MLQTTIDATKSHTAYAGLGNARRRMALSCRSNRLPAGASVGQPRADRNSERALSIRAPTTGRISHLTFVAE